MNSWESLTCGLWDWMSDAFLEKSEDGNGLTQLCMSEKRKLQQEWPAHPVLGEAEWTVDGAWVDLHESHLLHWTSHQSPSEDEPPLGQLPWGQPQVYNSIYSLGPFNVADIPSLCPNFGGVRAAAGQRKNK